MIEAIGSALRCSTLADSPFGLSVLVSAIQAADLGFGSDCESVSSFAAGPGGQVRRVRQVGLTAAACAKLLHSALVTPRRPCIVNHRQPHLPSITSLTPCLP
jgi:hypothetical protein